MTPAQRALEQMLADHDAQEGQRRHTWMVERVHVKERQAIVEALRRVRAAESEAEPVSLAERAKGWLSL